MNSENRMTNKAELQVFYIGLTRRVIVIQIKNIIWILVSQCLDNNLRAWYELNALV